MTPEFKKAFDNFFDGCAQIIEDHRQAYGFSEQIVGKLAFTKGRRYIRVTLRSAAYAFVDLHNGDVLKPASYDKPAKHARGNIFDATNGLKRMGPYGPAYLR